ncbi:carboxyl transferase domain-containing protein [Legionella waltersii]|uniref:Acetyl CoA carboxylase subunit alpha n=1 Tax=Legionella waltersii TaxID=66969 RepID=A0A0W1A0H9_9GAMM|nr:carboxyl transferase domain-containing protein [Legionella waltersii]KTD74624.1 acetyl CoA carboxylase subunit alpha [Legionella waltersii]SNV08868.1 acetyl CoA carboxylase subunit alpha [Legionella waltersii]
MPLQPTNNKLIQWIDRLIDKNSFQPINTASTNSLSLEDECEVLAGLATVNQQPIALYAQDNSINRGYIRQEGGMKIIHIMDKAKELNIPIIALLGSPGVYLEDDLLSGDIYTQILSRNIQLSGQIPQIAVIIAPTLGAPAYSAVLMDFLFFNKHRSYLMVTSPMVVQQAIGEKTTMAELGSASLHATVTGIADFVADNATVQIDQVKTMLAYLPSNSRNLPPRHSILEPTKPLPEIPNNPKIPFNMLNLIHAIVDNSTTSLYKQSYGQAMICAFVHINGLAVGIMANQSIRLSGAIDCEAAQKASKFLRLCDSYCIPILTLIDVPGFMPGKREEQRSLLLHGARLCTAMQTRVPRLSLIVRKCYGAAGFLMMQTRSQNGDLVLALESANLGIMDKTTTNKVQTIDAQTSNHKQQLTKDSPHSLDDSLVQAYQLGLIDELIKPHQIRSRLSHHLELLYKKMDNLPPARHSIF